MRRNTRFLLSILSAAAICSSCNDDNTSTLSSLKMPGDMFIAQRCTINGQIAAKNEAECSEANGIFVRSLYAANISTASVAYIKYYPSSTEFESIDITSSVPGVSAIPVGERPQSITGDDLGAFILVTSAVNNELSIISISSNREIAYQKLDKKPIKATFRKADNAFYILFADGTLRKLSITFDCGQGKGVLTETCALTKDSLTLTWNDIAALDGQPVDYAEDPVKPRAYVSFANRRFISVIGFDSTAGTCADGTSIFPCEISRLGAGFGCSDGIDNNGDGLIDEKDPSCFYPWSAEGKADNDANIPVGYVGLGECNDGIDNNNNGFIDALDPGCVSSSDSSEEPGFQPFAYGSCFDGIDNSGSGKIDRDDPFCGWPTVNEDADSAVLSPSVGVCADGIDNDNDGTADAEDSACYGSGGLSEIPITSSGRGQMDIDPLGRWLYVLDPVDSQLIVIDLETEKTIDRSGWFPRNRTVGIPVSSLALDVAADIRTKEEYTKGTRKVTSERAVAYVSSSSGGVTEYLIHQTLNLSEGTNIISTASEIAMRPTDTDDDASYIGVVRCVGRICLDSDLPSIDLRRRPAIAYFASNNTISHTNPDTGLPHSVVYDSIMASETWTLAYEGKLDSKDRGDGYFSADGTFHTGIDLCAIGAQPGDRLILRNRKGIRLNPPEICAPFLRQDNGKEPALEWEIVSVGPQSLSLKIAEDDDLAKALPNDKCFTTGLDFEIRSSNEWILTSKNTYVNRRWTIGNTCIDNPLHPYGQTRFKFNPDNPDDKTADYHAQTAFFSIKMPSVSHTYIRGDAFEFTTKTGLSPLTVSVGAAPSAMKVFRTDNAHFLLISESSANTIIVYDIDDEGIDDTL